MHEKISSLAVENRRTSRSTLGPERLRAAIVGGYLPLSGRLPCNVRGTVSSGRD
jgi:hypothetical protein